jgi:hypothetical protein
VTKGAPAHWLRGPCLPPPPSLGPIAGEAALHPCRMAGAGRTRVQCRNRRFRAS